MAAVVLVGVWAAGGTLTMYWRVLEAVEGVVEVPVKLETEDIMQFCLMIVL